MKKVKLLTAAVALLLVAALTACYPASIRSTDLCLGYTRSLNTVPPQSEVSTGAGGELTDVTLELFRHSTAALEKGENNVISPLSAVICLAMMANGSAGQTREQIEQALGMTVEQLDRCLYGYLEGLDTQNVTLVLANSIWLEDTIAEYIKSDFLQTNTDYFDAEIYSTPMDSSTIRDVNSWVGQKTDGLIDSILETLPDQTRAILINALLFEAKWQSEYEKSDIKDGSFTNYDGTTAKVDMLCSTETYMSYGGAKGFVRPYKGGNYALVGLLPPEDTDVYDYIASMTGDTWRALWSSRGGSAKVRMPEFKCEADIDLIPLMKQLGITDMFMSNVADFSEITTATELTCAVFEQKSVIEVDRNGTKAAAVSWGIANDSAADITFHSVVLDRPFVYAIVDCQTGLPMFIGTMVTMG